MLKAGLIGIGFMGRTHLKNYIRLEEEGFPVRLTSICDIDSRKFQGIYTEGNIQVPSADIDYSRYRQYTDIDRMLEEEELDFVDIVLPTYLHKEVTLKALRKGLHVLCEKPMALNSADGAEMIRVSKETGRKLMIAHCLRFWPEYEYLKETVASGRYGKVRSASFYRLCSPPIWTYENWMIRAETSGGGLLDFHIHDIDIIHWLFGRPLAVTTVGGDVLPESTLDVLSAQYLYEDRKVVTAHMDRSIEGDVGFEMAYRVTFEGGTLLFEKRVLKDHPKDGRGFVPELSKDAGYYREIRYFANAIRNNTPVDVANPEDTLTALLIAEAERQSAFEKGTPVPIATPSLSV
ncbi:Gfo/Idh/MocA family oxidoreductase [Paenibacillus aurantius]|uniref:Gfo/Idh/MocA family oxidoreductase n=1 Tax=Paenibacillus aurantius TaxID=2918900 RepID=A0AA96RDE0_9BACL|nr:Gfo/Idh/MocA family oxidoreductase [Paenibacillus aurantius]WNQ08983.1 Gfo/Idh/MocA family oxidoreductase [Paenibacillus aurantius]